MIDSVCGGPRVSDSSGRSSGLRGADPAGFTDARSAMGHETRALCARKRRQKNRENPKIRLSDLYYPNGVNHVGAKGSAVMVRRPRHAPDAHAGAPPARSWRTLARWHRSERARPRAAHRHTYVHTCIYAYMHIRIYAHACMHICMYAACTACSCSARGRPPCARPSESCPEKARKPATTADQNKPRPAREILSLYGYT